MALTDGENGNGLVMPVAPIYGGGNNGNNNGWGGDWAWIILLLLLGWGNNGNGGFGGGFGGFGGGFGGDFPWLMNGQQTIMANTNNGFRDQMINDGITSIRDGIGNLSTQLCNCCSDMQMSLANGFAGVEQGANARQMANMQSIFGVQSALQECCCENRAGIADLKYTVATENCADRTAAYQNTRDIIDSQTRGTQAILDKLCQLELDGVKAQVDAKNDRIVELQTQLNMANLAASQTRQTTDIQNSIISELRSCPIPSQPVYGSQPIFTCPNNNNGCGCGCGSF